MIFIDANIFMYAAGRESTWRAPCQRFLGRIVRGENSTRPCTNAEVLQEILHRYRSIGVAAKGLQLFDAVVNLGILVLAVDETDMRRARVLLEESPSLSTRDAVHVGVMQGHGITRVVSYDRGFDAVAGLDRLEP